MRFMSNCTLIHFENQFLSKYDIDLIKQEIAFCAFFKYLIVQFYIIRQRIEQID